jgi:cyclopropane-fatty-acyl-phospholipid synthase
MHSYKKSHRAQAITADTGAPLTFPVWDPWAAGLTRAFQHLTCGRLLLELWDGSEMVFAGPQDGPSAHVRFNSRRAVRRTAFGGDVGFAEAYMVGECDSGDLVALIELFACNLATVDSSLSGTAVCGFWNRICHVLKPNSRRGSRKNIAYHYDLGNGFYEQWLDPSMTYSSALYEDGVTDLSEAQQRKYQRVAELLDLSPGQHILEIGCGWGGFAEYVARDHGCRVTGLTLSNEQHAYATDRIARAGLQDRVEIRLQDYRDVQGRFDRIASIEMFEAVGEKNWPTYFQTIRDRLAPSGNAVLQVISIAEDRYEQYRTGADFIQRYIFPGGMLPTPALLEKESEQAGLRVSHADQFGESYRRTLAEWSVAFESAWPRVRALGYDERFRRMWRYYLAYCEAGFRVGTIDVGHYKLVHG